MPDEKIPLSKAGAQPAPTATPVGGDGAAARRPAAPVLPKEVGGAAGPEPTRYGDWQHKGRVTDF